MMSRESQLAMRLFAVLTDLSPSFNQFNVTRSLLFQFRVFPDQRIGCVCCAARYTLALFCQIAVFVPVCRDAGVVRRIPLCTWSWWYQ
jgi:hypothetical protein